MGFWGGKERRKRTILRTVLKTEGWNETLAGSTQNISESGVLIEMYWCDTRCGRRSNSLCSLTARKWSYLGKFIE